MSKSSRNTSYKIKISDGINPLLRGAVRMQAHDSEHHSFELNSSKMDVLLPLPSGGYGCPTLTCVVDKFSRMVTFGMLTFGPPDGRKKLQICLRAVRRHRRPAYASSRKAAA